MAADSAETQTENPWEGGSVVVMKMKWVFVLVWRAWGGVISRGDKYDIGLRYPCFSFF